MRFSYKKQWYWYSSWRKNFTTILDSTWKEKNNISFVVFSQLILEQKVDNQFKSYSNCCDSYYKLNNWYIYSYVLEFYVWTRLSSTKFYEFHQRIYRCRPNDIKPKWKLWSSTFGYHFDQKDVLMALVNIKFAWNCYNLKILFNDQIAKWHL